MYARPELVDAHRHFWQSIRQQLGARGVVSPSVLSQNAEEFAVWRDPDLVLSQTCGMPYRLFLHDSVKLVGTPDYALTQCEPGYYRSAFVVRADDKRSCLNDFTDARFAFNQVHSQSGFAAPYQHMLQNGFWFRRFNETGGHARSAHAVAQRQADIACLDGVTWRLLEQHDPLTNQLRVLEWTQSTPGLPYISAAGANPHIMFAAVRQAISDLPSHIRQRLGIRDLVKIDKSEYLAIPNPPDSASSHVPANRS